MSRSGSNLGDIPSVGFFALNGSDLPILPVREFFGLRTPNTLECQKAGGTGVTTLLGAQAAPFLLLHLEPYRFDEDFVAHLKGNVVVGWLYLGHLDDDFVVSLFHNDGLEIVLLVG